MAQAALRKRDNCASKLRDLVRQLRRYLDGDSQIERILTQKSEKVDGDREELIAKHIDYAEKAAIGLDEQELTDFIVPRIDTAVDIVDEATVRIEELQLTAKTRADQVSNDVLARQSRLELAAARKQSESCKRLVESIMTEIGEVVAVEQPQEEHALKTETYLSELEEREKELNKSWNGIKSLLTEEVDIQAVTTQSETETGRILQCRRDAKFFMARIRGSPAVPTPAAGSGSRPAVSHMKLQRAKPPKFSGDIREFARFKAYFEKIVMKEHGDPVYQGLMAGVRRDLLRHNIM